MKKVVKFGGSSLANAEQFKKVINIIKSDSRRRYAVPSAPGRRFSEDTKVTDMLYGCYALAEEGKPFDKELKAIKERYQEIIDGSGAKDRIFLYPQYIRDSEVKKYFSAADVTVLPYRSATQSGISSVSYHFEVPMIVTAVGGLKETIGDRGTGIVAEEVTPGCIRKEIERYFLDDGIRKNCIEQIRKEKQRLSWSGFAGGLLSFAEKL